MKLQIYVCLFFGLFLCNSLFADSSCNPQGCFSTHIDRLYLRNNGDHLIGTSGDESVLNCTADSNRYIAIDADDSNKKDIYSALLAAYMANKIVNIRITEGSSNCGIAYITLDRQ